MMKIGFWFVPVLLAVSCVSSSPKKSALIADADPISLGTAEIEFDKMFSSALEKKEVPLTFNPRDDTVSLEFRYQTVVYRQYWDRAGRDRFIAAVKRYHDDFEARNLTDKASKSRTAYGTVNGKTEWGQFSFSVNARSYPRIDLGYQFKGKNPYFTVVQREARDTIMPSADDARMSLRITSYFTRQEANTLAALLDQEYLLGILEAQGIPLETGEPASDVYQAQDAARDEY
ncbi:MAG: hypothetical protein LBQ30_06610 [Treponema sp.]|jgi:hypothetical protein|nr:hypothetical protein [Treponema sp.]